VFGQGYDATGNNHKIGLLKMDTLQTKALPGSLDTEPIFESQRNVFTTRNGTYAIDWP